MKKIFLLIFILPLAAVFAQTNNGTGKMQQKIEDQQKQIDSTLKNLDSLNANIIKQSTNIDSLERARNQQQMNHNMDSFYSEMKERQDKEKRAAWMRIGFGILILAFGLFAIFRRRKPKLE